MGVITISIDCVIAFMEGVMGASHVSAIVRYLHPIWLVGNPGIIKVIIRDDRTCSRRTTDNVFVDVDGDVILD